MPQLARLFFTGQSTICRDLKKVGCPATRKRPRPWRTKNLREAIFSKVVKGPECWGWNGAVQRSGYPCIRWKKKGYTVSRLVYELENGPIAAGQCVLHRCDNPECVNPEHLFLGSQADNIADMIAKGRAYWQQPDFKPAPRNRNEKGQWCKT